MTSANELLGPHLLKRVYVRDDRDWKLAPFLTTAADPLDAALAALVARRWTAKTVKDWATVITARVKTLVPPAPAPPPAPTPSGDIVWADTDPVLDQGQTGHCVGFGWAQWGNTLPIDDHFADDDGHKVYYETKIIDGEPGAEDGSSVRSGAKAMQGRKRLAAYAFAANIGEVVAWVTTKGPVVFGTDWTTDMFTPNADGLIRPTGNVEGGHCYVCIGYHPKTDLLEFINSWGDWGKAGHFFMTKTDAATLLAAQGDACAAVELAA